MLTINADGSQTGTDTDHPNITFMVPAAPAEPRTIQPSGTIQEIRMRGGFFAFRRADGTGPTTIRAIEDTSIAGDGSTGTALTDIQIVTDDQNDVQWNVWYRAANVYGLESERIQGQDYRFRSFQGDQEATALVLLDPNPIAAVLTPSAVTNETANVTAGSLTGTQGTWTLIDGFNGASGDRTQAAMLALLDTRLFMEVVAANQLTNAQRPIQFGINANGGTTTCTDRIILTTGGNQIFVGAINGFESGTSGIINLVVSSEIALTVGTLEQIAAVGGVSEARTIDLLNQQSDAIQGANVPGKGLLGTPNRVA